MVQDPNLPDMRLDADALYREETFTDLRAGSIRRMVPVTREGKDDPSRPAFYEGHASLMTQRGPLPLQFHIEANTLEEALAKFPDLAKEALAETLEQIRKLQREAQSSIVVPGGGGGLGGGGLGGGLIKP
jgi:hypothetical protein